MSNIVYKKCDSNVEKSFVASDEINREALSKELVLRVQVSGKSMHPFIQSGDTLLIEAARAKNLNLGDIALVYFTSGKFLIHRVIRKNNPGTLLTNGDSLRQPDEPVTDEQVFGRVIQVERSGRILNLSGLFNNINARLISLLARNRLPLQLHLKQILGELNWFLRGKRKA